MATIKITVEKDSSMANFIKLAMKEKQGFKEAVQSGNIEEYAKKNGHKYSKPV